MNCLDLFSGIGGFALGAYWAGWRFERHYFSEIDPWCVKLYSRRFPDAVPLGDIREIDGRALIQNTSRMECKTRAEIKGEVRTVATDKREHDHSHGSSEAWVLTGGFPCQDISVAGKGAGISGERSGLWFEYARLICEIRPRYAIMENVGALTRRGLDRVLGSLAEIGYDAEWSDIRASDLGAPHRRERIWIVAYPHGFGWREGRAEPIGTRKAVSCGNSEVPDPTSVLGQSIERSEPDGVLSCVLAHSNAIGWEGRPDATSRDGIRWWDAFEGCSSRKNPWTTEPAVGRVAHGIPARVDRLRGLGNSIVPQIAEMIFRELKG
jgi:DNA (cytosine-5)-methyltransferase 1